MTTNDNDTRIQTLVGCKECGRGFPFRDMADHPDGDGYICPRCYAEFEFVARGDEDLKGM